MIFMTTRRKISATVAPDLLERAQHVSGASNLSQLLDAALGALIEQEQEHRWLDAHAENVDDTDLPGAVGVDLCAMPWDDSESLVRSTAQTSVQTSPATSGGRYWS